MGRETSKSSPVTSNTFGRKAGTPPHKILIVDDEPTVVTFVERVLNDAGYATVSASDGEQALALWAVAGPFSLLLTDVVMPRMSGPELARRLQAIRPELKVLCMSGYTDDSVVRHGVLGSGVAYLRKPLTAGLLARKVREVLDGRRMATLTEHSSGLHAAVVRG